MRSDRRRSSGRGEKTFYTKQATRGLQFCEFLTNTEGKGFSLLGFIPSFKCFAMFELTETVRGRLIGSKAWNRSGKF